jgi:hypothetical protein
METESIEFFPLFSRSRKVLFSFASKQQRDYSCVFNGRHLYRQGRQKLRIDYVVAKTPTQRVILALFSSSKPSNNHHENLINYKGWR